MGVRRGAAHGPLVEATELRLLDVLQNDPSIVDQAAGCLRACVRVDVAANADVLLTLLTVKVVLLLGGDLRS